MRAADLLRRLDDKGFKPFRVHLSDGTKIDVNQPGMVIVGLSSAILPTKFTTEQGRRVAYDWRTIAISHIVQFSDLPRRRNGKKSAK
jgi:hypothetical protein